MPGSKYLPSAQFVVIVGAIALSGGLVLAAQFITREPTPAALTSSNTELQGASDWKADLYAVQGTNPLEIQSSASVSASLDTLLNEAQTNNVTETIGRSLLLNLSQAKTQGLGSDIPTQEKLLAQASDYLQPTPAQVYTLSSLSTVADSPTTLQSYGNAFIEVLLAHPKANMQDTYVAVGSAVDTNDASQLKALETIGKEYEAITKELLSLPVPKTLSPLHLRIVNNFSQIAASFNDMRTVIGDPLRGFGGLQTYNALTAETARMFTNIAQSFAKNGILFTKDEPGSAWSAFLPQ